MIATDAVQLVDLATIKPSPENDELYGKITTDNELIDLANDIARNGILEPFVALRDYWIVSGHRRYAAAKIAKIKQVPVKFLDHSRDDYTDHEYLRLLRRYNHQRHKSLAQRLREKMVDADPDLAYEQLVKQRGERPLHVDQVTIRGAKLRSGISAAKQPMLRAAQLVIEQLRDYLPVTVRQVHYKLLNNPPMRHKSKPDSVYRNDRKSYQDLTDLLTRARLTGDIPFDSLADETRPISNTRFSRDAADFVDSEVYHLFRNYRRDLMQSQRDHVELIVEKITCQGIIQPIANEHCVPMTIGRGYCSIGPRRAIVQRFQESAKDRLILLVASDFDPDGEEICESFGRSIRDDFGIDPDRISLHKILLTHDQVTQWALPANGMEAKQSSSNYEKFAARYGDDVYELEAVDPATMQTVVRDSIRGVIDLDAFLAEVDTEKQEALKLRSAKEIIIETIRDTGLWDEF
jgi:hypothetical protein